MFKLEKGVWFDGWIDVPQRGGRIEIGKGARISRFVEFSVPESGELIIGDGVFIGRGVVISAHNHVSIGSNSMIAEYVCIHDNNHSTAHSNMPISSQGFVSAPIQIGSDCWIGAKAVILKGSGLGDRCVVGAAGVVTKKYPSNFKVVGIPARPMKSRPNIA